MKKEKECTDLRECLVAPNRQLNPVDILFVAGEHSGDQHAAACVRTLKQIHPEFNICAVGGPALKAAGADLLLDMTQWSVVGLFEVLKHYSLFQSILDWLVHWIEIYQPKIVCLVDFPGFNLRLAQRLFDKKISHKAGGQVRVYMYVAPQIWAWKSRRRFRMAQILDKLAVIFSFEKDCFKDTTLPTTYVGHPLLKGSNPFHYSADGELLLLPGSRPGPVQRILPLLLKSFAHLREKNPNLKALICYPDNVIKTLLEKILSSHPLKHAIHLCSAQDSLNICGALMSSGTASLKIALAGIPGVVAYRAHLLTYYLGRAVVKVPYLSMTNILLKREAYPEFLQGSTRQAFKIAQCMQNFLSNPKISHQRFVENAEELHKILAMPADKSLAEWLIY